MSDPIPPAAPQVPMTKFRGLGSLSARMAIIQNYPIHVNGAYREPTVAIARMRI